MAEYDLAQELARTLKESDEYKQLTFIYSKGYE